MSCEQLGGASEMVQFPFRPVARSVQSVMSGTGKMELITETQGLPQLDSFDVMDSATWTKEPVYTR